MSKPEEQIYQTETPNDGKLSVWLEECPFCGEKAHLTVNTYTRGSDYAFVRCGRCLAEGPLCGTEDAAKQRWNARVKTQ